MYVVTGNNMPFSICFGFIPTHIYISLDWTGMWILHTWIYSGLTQLTLGSPFYMKYACLMVFQARLDSVDGSVSNFFSILRVQN